MPTLIYCRAGWENAGEQQDLTRKDGRQKNVGTDRQTVVKGKIQDSWTDIVTRARDREALKSHFF